MSHRVAMYTTVRERCGIADYSAALSIALREHIELETVVLRPNRLNPFALAADARRLGRADVAHVQHTYSFFGVDALTYTLAWRVLRAAIRAPLVVTAHTVRPDGPARYAGGLGSALANAVGAPAWHDVETFRRAEAVIVHAGLHRDRLPVPARRHDILAGRLEAQGLEDSFGPAGQEQADLGPARRRIVPP